MVTEPIRLNGKKILIIAVAISLLFILPITVTAVLPKIAPTKIVLDSPVKEANNGDTITFTGKLVKALDRAEVPSATVTIYDKKPKQDVVLATGPTDSNGDFRIPWVAKPADAFSNTVTAFAVFSGNVEYEPSRTAEYNINIVTKYSIDVRADRNFYYVGDKAIFTVDISGPSNNPFAPSDIHSFLDGMLANLNQIDTGHYRYVSKELTFGTHTLSVNAKISTPESKFRNDFNTISSSAQIHVIKRPTSMTASVKDKVYFVGDQIKVDATLLDVVRGEYITNKNLTAYFNLPDLTKRDFAFSPHGNALNGTYSVRGDDTFGQWTGLVKFDGDNAMQSSQVPLTSFKVNDYRVKPVVSHEGNVTIINFKSHEDNELDTYQVVVKGNWEEVASIRAPNGWSSTIGNATTTIYFITDSKPIKPGKALEFQVETSQSMQTFTWEVRDIDSNVIVSGKYPLS